MVLHSRPQRSIRRRRPADTTTPPHAPMAASTQTIATSPSGRCSATENPAANKTAVIVRRTLRKNLQCGGRLCGSRGTRVTLGTRSTAPCKWPVRVRAPVLGAHAASFRKLEDAGARSTQQPLQDVPNHALPIAAQVETKPPCRIWPEPALRGPPRHHALLHLSSIASD